MYDKIVNPTTGRRVSIYGKLGQSIIRNYFNSSNLIGGKGILHIDKKTNTKWNCNIEMRDDKMFFESKNKRGKKIPINIIKKIRGGKSGDNVIMIESEGNNYILKVFSPGDDKKIKKDTDEVQNHIAFSKLFKTIYPCPKIHIYGNLYGKNPFTENTDLDDNSNTMYYIMEYIEPYFELHHYLHMICTGESGTEGYQYEFTDIHLLLLQLFYIISKMKLAKIHHCDMHAQNIMIIPNTNSSIEELEFNHLSIDRTINVGNTLIKVIDFGEGASDNKRCSKRRTTSSSLAKTAKSCLGRIGMTNHYKTIASEQIYNASGDSDLNFFINIVKICKSVRKFKKKLYHIDTEKLTFLSNKMHKGNNKEVLSHFLVEISKGLPLNV